MWILYTYFGEATGEFSFDIRHKDREENDKKIRGEWAALPDAGSLGGGGGARVGFLDFKSRVSVDILDKGDMFLWKSESGKGRYESDV